VARDRTVLFGGFTNTNVNQTWLWNGEGWTPAAPPTSPPPRNGHAAAYMSSIDRVVIFGGSGPTGALSDTWVWDGTTWTDVTPSVSPPGRHGQAMAYDARRARLVLLDAAGATWEFDGATWASVVSSGGPATRDYYAIAYDPIRQRVVLTGGLGVNVRGDTWEWDGTQWHHEVQLDADARWWSALVYSAVERRILMFGGFGFVDARGTAALVINSPFITDERCVIASGDDDQDGLAGCADPDCWGRCSPLCPPGLSCNPAAPRCGDGACDGLLEDRSLCPADCP
jgi:hypothetical protein